MPGEVNPNTRATRATAHQGSANARPLRSSVRTGQVWSPWQFAGEGWSGTIAGAKTVIPSSGTKNVS